MIPIEKKLRSELLTTFKHKNLDCEQMLKDGGWTDLDSFDHEAGQGILVSMLPDVFLVVPDPNDTRMLAYVRVAVTGNIDAQTNKWRYRVQFKYNAEKTNYMNNLFDEYVEKLIHDPTAAGQPSHVIMGNLVKQVYKEKTDLCDAHIDELCSSIHPSREVEDVVSIKAKNLKDAPAFDISKPVVCPHCGDSHYAEPAPSGTTNAEDRDVMIYICPEVGPKICAIDGKYII